MTRSEARPIAAPSGFPPNVEPWSPWLENVHELGVGDGRRDRVDSAAQGLTHDEHVRPDVLPLAAEEASGPTEPRLDFVRHKRDAPLPADLGGP